MVRLRFLLASLILAAPWPAASHASPWTFTGNVENDMPIGDGLRGLVIDNPVPGPPGMPPTSNPRDVNIPDWMLQEGRETGWNFKDIRLAYDAASDSLAVGINFFGVGGDIDGDGNPNSADPRTIASGGKDEPRFANGETVAVAFDLNNDRLPDIIAGIPLAKPLGPDGERLDGIASFSLAKYFEHPGGLAFGFGETQVGSTDLLSHLGQLSIETSLERPDMQFEIKNFTALGKLFNASFDPLGSTIGLEAFAAGLDDVIVGEDYVPYQAVSPQTIIPEPSTVLAWSLLVGSAAAWQYRRRRSLAAHRPTV